MQTMNDIQRLSALKLPWDVISRYLETLISAILGRSFTCSTKGEDDNYWSTSVLCDTFTNVEIVRLVNAVNGDDNMLRHALPVDSTASRSLEMGLCQALLKRALRLDWENEFVSPDALFIIGKFPTAPELPGINQNLIHIDSTTIDSSTLMSKDEFIEKLFDEGGTFTDQAFLCEANETAYGTPLYWMHPLPMASITAVILFWFGKVCWYSPMMRSAPATTRYSSGTAPTCVMQRKCAAF